MNRHKIPFLDFYRQHNISPVAQDISDLNKHFDRRNALYRHCGIPPCFIKGKHVLEIGPGTGHNALFTNAMQPDRYVLVDGNSKSIQETSRLLGSYFDDISNCEIVEIPIENFTSDIPFDLAICEGVISGQVNPAVFLKSISNFVAPGGILLITCNDSVSILSEMLRRIAAQLIIGNERSSLPEKLDKLRPFFSRHLGTLKGMSRSNDDWIYDNIFHPIIGKMLSIEDAIKALSNEFQVYGVSPHFFTDWRWYKDIHGDGEFYNDLAIDSYRRNIHNLLDYRFVFEAIDPETGLELAGLCTNVLEIALSVQNEDTKAGYLSALVKQLDEILSVIVKFSVSTADSLREITSAFRECLAGKAFSTTLDRFAPWFGRGQQYLSFIKRTSSFI